MKTLYFKETMPTRGSWNNKWSGDGYNNGIKIKVSEKQYNNIYKYYNAKTEFTHRWDDGWTVCFTIIDGKTLSVSEKRNWGKDGCQYPNFIDEIVNCTFTEGKYKEGMYRNIY